jgi:hypothetical protein
VETRHHCADRADHRGRDPLRIRLQFRPSSNALHVRVFEILGVEDHGPPGCPRLFTPTTSPATTTTCSKSRSPICPRTRTSMPELPAGAYASVPDKGVGAQKGGQAGGPAR